MDSFWRREFITRRESPGDEAVGPVLAVAVELDGALQGEVFVGGFKEGDLAVAVVSERGADDDGGVHALVDVEREEGDGKAPPFGASGPLEGGGDVGVVFVLDRVGLGVVGVLGVVVLAGESGVGDVESFLGVPVGPNFGALGRGRGLLVGGAFLVGIFTRGGHGRNYTKNRGRMSRGSGALCRNFAHIFAQEVLVLLARGGKPCLSGFG